MRFEIQNPLNIKLGYCVFFYYTDQPKKIYQSIHCVPNKAVAKKVFMEDSKSSEYLDLLKIKKIVSL